MLRISNERLARFGAVEREFTFMKKYLVAAVLAMAAVSVGGCNTVQGIGKDISSVGRKGEEVLDNSR